MQATSHGDYNTHGGVQCRLHHMVITIHMEEYSAGYITWWLQYTWRSTVQATSHGDYNTHGGIQCRLHHMVITIHMEEYSAGYITWWLQYTWWSTVQDTSHGDYNTHAWEMCVWMRRHTIHPFLTGIVDDYRLALLGKGFTCTTNAVTSGGSKIQQGQWTNIFRPYENISIKIILLYLYTTIL